MSFKHLKDGTKKLQPGEMTNILKAKTKLKFHDITNFKYVSIQGYKPPEIKHGKFHKIFNVIKEYRSRNNPTYYETIKRNKILYDNMKSVKGQDLIGSNSQTIIDKLDVGIQNTLKQKNITSLYKAQTATFDKIIKGKDLLIQSPKGTGKTLSFVLPAITKMIQEVPVGREEKETVDEKLKGELKPTILCIVHSKERAMELEKIFGEFTEKNHLGIGIMFPGEMKRTSLHIMRYLNNYDLIISTPKRAVDLIGSEILTENLKTIIIDDMVTMFAQNRVKQLRQLMVNAGKIDEEGLKLKTPQVLIYADETPLHIVKPCKEHLLFHRTFEHLKIYEDKQTENLEMVNNFRKSLGLPPIENLSENSKPLNENTTVNL